MKENHPVLWAVDPYSKIQKKSFRALKFIRQLSPSKPGIELTYIVSPESLKWDSTFSTLWLNRLQSTALKAMSKVHLKGVSGQNALINSNSKRASDAQFICQYAKQRKAEFMVLNTHARAGLERMFLGSFTEAALSKTEVPLLILNPHAKLPAKVRRVLVPIDLTPKSVAAFKTMIPFLQGLKAEVILYYKLMDPIEPVVQSGVLMAGGGWVGFDQFRSRDIRKRKAEMQKVIRVLRKHRIAASGIVEDRFGLIPNLAQQVAKRERCQLILMGTQVGVAGTILWGSVARAMARESRLPLMVFPIR